MTLAGFQERQRIADLLSSDAKESILADVRSAAIDLAGVRNFGDLHDFVDANLYLVGRDDSALAFQIFCEAHISDPQQKWDLLNEVTEQVDRWIGEGGLHKGNEKLRMLRLDNVQDRHARDAVKRELSHLSPGEISILREMTHKRHDLLAEWETQPFRCRKRQQEIRQLKNGLGLLAELGHGYPAKPAGVAGGISGPRPASGRSR